MSAWEKILIKPNDSLEYAIKVLHEGGCRITLVVDERNKLLGTVTDGDIRRALINKLTMDSEIRLTMNNQPIMDRSYFEDLSDSFRSPHIWKREDGLWKLRRTVYKE